MTSAIRNNNNAYRALSIPALFAILILAQIHFVAADNCGYSGTLAVTTNTPQQITFHNLPAVDYTWTVSIESSNGDSFDAIMTSQDGGSLNVNLCSTSDHNCGAISGICLGSIGSPMCVAPGGSFSVVITNNNWRDDAQLTVSILISAVGYTCTSSGQSVTYSSSSAPPSPPSPTPTPTPPVQQCPGNDNGNCNGQGLCNAGVCVCNSGWTGSDCTQSVVNPTPTPDPGFPDYPIIAGPPLGAVVGGAVGGVVVVTGGIVFGVLLYRRRRMQAALKDGTLNETMLSAPYRAMNAKSVAV